MPSDDAQKIADILEPYTRHKKSCSFSGIGGSPKSDFCTCGLSDAVDRVNEILNEDS